MTDKEQKCDVCGHSEYYKGVASSGLGPMSLAFCEVCLGMGAEPKFMIQNTIEGCGGVENVAARLVYYDREKDSYMDSKTDLVVPMLGLNHKSFLTRSDWLEYQQSLTRIINCPFCDRVVDISDWNMVDHYPCMCCSEHFEVEEVDWNTQKWIEKE